MYDCSCKYIKYIYLSMLRYTNIINVNLNCENPTIANTKMCLHFAEFSF